MLDEERALWTLDGTAAALSLASHPLTKSLKLKADVNAMEVDLTGRLWSRRIAARKAYFTVASARAEPLTIKNK